jgi:hypothetical protein
MHVYSSQPGMGWRFPQAMPNHARVDPKEVILLQQGST